MIWEMVLVRNYPASVGHLLPGSFPTLSVWAFILTCQFQSSSWEICFTWHKNITLAIEVKHSKLPWHISREIAPKYKPLMLLFSLQARSNQYNGDLHVVLLSLYQLFSMVVQLWSPQGNSWFQVLLSRSHRLSCSGHRSASILGYPLIIKRKQLSYQITVFRIIVWRTMVVCKPGSPHLWGTVCLVWGSTLPNSDQKSSEALDQQFVACFLSPYRKSNFPRKPCLLTNLGCPGIVPAF